MKKLRHPILALILLWVCIAAVLIAGNIVIVRLISRFDFNAVCTNKYTSLLASYLVQPGMQEDVATFILGGESRAVTGLKIHGYSIFGGGGVFIIINSQTGTVSQVDRVGELRCWIFYGFMVAVAFGEVIFYRRLRKEQGFDSSAEENAIIYI